MTTRTETAVESGATVFIPLNKLKKSPHNARRTPHPDAAIEALAASIQTKGMLQNLVVEPERDAQGKETGVYVVSAGEGRRLAQLLRARRRQIKKTEPIRCVVDTTNDPHEISLDENVTRTQMHPADQFDAFRRLSEERGWGAEEIAARFGVTPSVVRQRLRLAAVSPRLMQLYRDGELTLDQLMAFAIGEDHERQEQVYDHLGWNQEPRSIRHYMMEAHVPPNDRVGSAADNALMESFFGTLELELRCSTISVGLRAGSSLPRSSSGSRPGTTRAGGTRRSKTSVPSTSSVCTRQPSMRHDHPTRAVRETGAGSAALELLQTMPSQRRDRDRREWYHPPGRPKRAVPDDRPPHRSPRPEI